jgi:diphthine-ammonia ligase
MKFAALVSGGTDSIYSIIQCIENGHELVACVHIGAPPTPDIENNSGSDHDEESYMYQSAASEAVKILVEECLCVPLIFYTRKGASINISLVYDEASSQIEKQKHDDNDVSTQYDEVEDLYYALLQVKQKFPDVTAVCSGAILSTYQRIRYVYIIYICFGCDVCCFTILEATLVFLMISL